MCVGVYVICSVGSVVYIDVGVCGCAVDSVMCGAVCDYRGVCVGVGVAAYCCRCDGVIVELCGCWWC